MRIQEGNQAKKDTEKTMMGFGDILKQKKEHKNKVMFSKTEYGNMYDMKCK